jgi:hypothetical protein
MFKKIAAIGLLLLATWLILDGLERMQFTVRQNRATRTEFERWRNLNPDLAATAPTPPARDRRPAYVRLGAGAALLSIGLLAHSKRRKRNPVDAPDDPA